MTNPLTESVTVGKCKITLHDAVAAVVAIATVTTVMALAVVEKPVTDSVLVINGFAMAWLFRGAADALTTNGKGK